MMVTSYFRKAVVLLSKQYKDKTWYNRFAPYWRSLPSPNSTLFCKEMMTSKDKEMLQDDELAADVDEAVTWARKVYTGNSTWWESLLGMAPRKTFQKELGTTEHNIAWEDFLHATCLVGAYAFACLRGWGRLATCMLPLLDLINHSDAGTANARVEQNDNGSYSCYALRDIQAGEQVTQTYSPVVARSDHALMRYGFAQDTETPLLAGVDHVARFEYEDDSLYDEHQSLRSVKELQRLQAILARFPTTEDEDTLLLQGGDTMDFRAKTIIRFRIQRKRALRKMVEKLRRLHPHADYSADFKEL